MRFKLSAVAILLLASAASCAPHPPPPPPPSAVGNQPLTASTQVPGAMVYRVPNIDQLPPPRCFYIPDAQVYNGPNAQYFGVDDPEKQVVATEITNAFRREIGRHQRLCQASAPRVATLQLTLVGLRRTVPSDISSSTNPYSSILIGGVTGGANLQAAVNGSITVAGKITDSTGALLAGFVNSVSSNDFTLPLDASARQIAQLGADKLAKDIAGAIDHVVALQRQNNPGA